MSSIVRRMNVGLICALFAGLPQVVLLARAPWLNQSKKPDYSQEAYVIEYFSQQVDFQNDGTAAYEITLRALVQSDAGVKQYGLLMFQYQQANDTLEIPYVRVRKPDGSTVATPAGNIQDLPADVTREAPFYSDVRQKHVAVRGLSAGDTLEYLVRIRTHTPLVQGHFWLAEDFIRSAIVLQETLEVSVPADRAVKTKFGDLKPAVSEEGGRLIYRWKTSNLKRQTEEESKAAGDDVPPPAVQFTTFQNFEEVGRWYEGLQRERVEPTPEIRAQATELIKGAKNDSEKLKAIYSFVALKFRYIGITFGIGRYQPNAASDVLANQYGDCKDKHTLLASLLKAAGFVAYPALINSARKTDLDVPSPAQFNHLITAIPEGDGYIWLDTTAEVAPYGFLLAGLRDKEALVMPEGKSPRLVRTPADPPFPSTARFHVEGKLNNSGTLDAKIDRTLRGDVEVILRAAFRQSPQPQWKDVVQNISYASGFAGSVSNIDVSAPEATDKPFRISYDYTRKEYPDWKNQRLSMPCPPFGLPSLKDNEDEKRDKLKLGVAVEFVYEGKIALPSGFTPDLPTALDLREDFAEYHSSYAFNDGVLSSERRLTIKAKEVPRERFEAYRKFAKAANEDERRYIDLRSATETAAGRQLNPEAAKLFAQAREAFQRRDLHASLDYLKRTVELDPKYPGAWGVIGFVHFQLNEVEEGVEAMRREIEVNPQNPRIYKSLGSTLMALKRWEDATKVWQELGKLDPQDSDVPLNVGWGLARLKRYKEAVPVLESAVELNPKGSEIRMQLAYAYLNIGETEKALKVYQKAAELDPRPYTWNNIAYDLAEKNQKLSVALEYAEKALRAEGIRAEHLSLEKLEIDDLRVPDLLSHIWGTLGWVYFLMGDLPQAEKYVAAAWSLSQHPAHADYLGQIYEKQGKKLAAIRAYAWALGASGGDLRGRLRGSAAPDASLDFPGIEETRQRLLKLVGNSAQLDARVRGAAEELSQMRTIKIKPIVSKLVSAEFFVLLSHGPKVEEAKFVSGDESLRKAGDALAAAKFDVLFPDDRPAKILRRGILMCHSISSGCEFVMYPPNSVLSIN